MSLFDFLFFDSFKNFQNKPQRGEQAKIEQDVIDCDSVSVVLGVVALLTLTATL